MGVTSKVDRVMELLLEMGELIPTLDAEAKARLARVQEELQPLLESLYPAEEDEIDRLAGTFEPHS